MIRSELKVQYFILLLLTHPLIYITLQLIIWNQTRQRLTVLPKTIALDFHYNVYFRKLASNGQVKQAVFNRWSSM